MQDALDLGLTSRSVDEVTGALLALLAGAAANAAERQLIVEAVVRDGRDNGGPVDLNRVRARLTDPATDRLRVKPQLVGAVVYSLRCAKVLTSAGWDTNDDARSGNSGKPQPRYRLAADYLPHRSPRPRAGAS